MNSEKIKTISAVLGGIVAIITITTLIVVNINKHIENTPSVLRNHEQQMVSRLKPEGDYAKMVGIIGAVPDTHKKLKSGRTIYQFDRPWEHIDLLVDQGHVISVGIYATSPDFRPVLDEGGKSITLNGPPISRQTYDSSPLGAWGECGGSSGGVYLEGYSLPHVYEFGSFILGWETPGSLMPDAVCGLVSPFNPCSKIITGLRLSIKLFNCVTNSNEDRSVHTDLHPSVVILVKPGLPMLPDVWNTEPLPS